MGKYKFSSREISDIKECMSTNLEIEIECIGVSLHPKDNMPLGEELTWAWANDSSRLKALWRQALIKNHGSGVVDEQTEKDIENFLNSNEYEEEMKKDGKKSGI